MDTLFVSAAGRNDEKCCLVVDMYVYTVSRRVAAMELRRYRRFERPPRWRQTTSSTDPSHRGLQSAAVWSTVHLRVLT